MTLDELRDFGLSAEELAKIEAACETAHAAIHFAGEICIAGNVAAVERARRWQSESEPSLVATISESDPGEPTKISVKNSSATCAPFKGPPEHRQAGKQATERLAASCQRLRDLIGPPNAPAVGFTHAWRILEAGERLLFESLFCIGQRLPLTADTTQKVEEYWFQIAEAMQSAECVSGLQTKIDGALRSLEDEAIAAVAASQPTHGDANGRWSSPDLPSRWAKIVFKVSLPTLRKMAIVSATPVAGKIRIKKLTRHRWQIHFDDLPEQIALKMRNGAQS